MVHFSVLSKKFAKFNCPMNPMDQDMNTYQIVIDEFYPICTNYIKNEY